MYSILRRALDAFDRYDEQIFTAAGACLFLAIGGLFFENRFPFLHPFIIWTFRIYLGLFAMMLVGLLVIAPGVLIFQDIYFFLLKPEASKFERRLTWMWCVGAGLLLSLLIGAAYALELSGRLTDIKVWFVSLCWTVLMIPYSVLGYTIKRLISKKKILTNESRG